MTFRHTQKTLIRARKRKTQMSLSNGVRKKGEAPYFQFPVTLPIPQQSATSAGLCVPASPCLGRDVDASGLATSVPQVRAEYILRTRLRASRKSRWSSGRSGPSATSPPCGNSAALRRAR